jgi:hypothetical protein
METMKKLREVRTQSLVRLKAAGTEPAWVLEYERQERRAATEVRKREMEERIVRVREKERREKLAAKKAGARPVKRRVIPESGLWLIVERDGDRGRE